MSGNWHGSYEQIDIVPKNNKKYIFNKEVEPYNFDMKKCAIMVPVYSEHMTVDERHSLQQLKKILGWCDTYLVCPKGMNEKEYFDEYGNTLRMKRYDSKFFEGREGYCKLMCSPFLYEDFSEYEYTLVYQLDCWVFSDKLYEWCDKGYDYIGAPFFVKWFSDRNIYVGNGGFSLRKNATIKDYLVKYSGKGLPHDGTDDGFFAANFDGTLKIPEPKVASEFSLEERPAEQYHNNGDKLPFGCHAYRRYNWKFWKDFIDYDAFEELRNNITFCVLNYNDSKNAVKWYKRYDGILNVYIIDTYIVDNGDDGRYNDIDDKSRIILEHNIYNGGQRQVAYKLMLRDKTKWMVTVDADVVMENDAYETRLLKSLDNVMRSKDIGVYECSAKKGSKCNGATSITVSNIHLFRQGSQGFRQVEEGEGWFRMVRKDIADKIYPFQNLDDNKYGWGGEAHYYLAKQMGLKTVIDDTVELYHPDGISYNNMEASKERVKFMNRFPELGIKIPKYKTAEEITTLVCCIGKNENRYVREYVEWYKNLGVSHIRIYDNNDTDGEHFEEVIQDYIDEGFVDLVDVRGLKVIQLKCYADCYKELKNDYDWILFIDCGDEYLCLANNMSIGQYLSLQQFRNFDMLHINLMAMNDNGQVEYEDKPLMERFPTPMPFDKCVAYDFPEDMHVSSIVRGGLEDIKWEGKGFTHTPSPNKLRCCNNVGFYVDSQSPFAPVDFQLAYFKHFSTKTASEYCDKMKRGFPDQIWDGSRIQNLIETRFFRVNDITKEKVQVFKDKLGVDMSYLLPKEEAVVPKRDDIKIYSLCFAQKDFEFINTDTITPLQVGAANGTDVCRLKDNTGDNISDKNFFYIENTGTYWIWKNVNGAKIKGQMQYRRPFSGITELDIDKAFETYDVITCTPFHHPDHKTPTAEEPMVIPADTVEQGYAFSNCIDDLYVLELIIQLYHPEYYDDYVKFIKNGPDLYYSNGFIMRSEDYDRYCEFLFDCLGKYLEMTGMKTKEDLAEHVRYNVEVGKYIRYGGQKRIPEEALRWQMSILGFLSERVWTLWLQHNFDDGKILKLPYIKQEEGMYT